MHNFTDCKWRFVLLKIESCIKDFLWINGYSLTVVVCLFKWVHENFFNLTNFSFTKKLKKWNRQKGKYDFDPFCISALTQIKVALRITIEHFWGFIYSNFKLRLSQYFFCTSPFVVIFSSYFHNTQQKKL